MNASGTMTTFAVNTQWDPAEFIFRSLHKIRISIVTAHAFKSYFPRETRIDPLFETRWKVPFLFLRIPGHWHLIHIPVNDLQVRIGMLSGSYNEIHLFYPLVNSVFPFQPKLFHPEAIALPER